MKKKYFIIIAAVLVVFVSIITIRRHIFIEKDENGASGSEIIDGEDEVPEYTSITMGEAKEIFQTQGDYVILDVRRADEFAQGHIPGAIHIANESIGEDILPELPDLSQTIYVYCRSGNRSKQASEKMVEIGYGNIIEFGGIIDWEGEIEKE